MRRDLFTEDHEAFRELARDFVEKEVVPAYPDWEKGGRMPRDVCKKMGALGMLGMAIPEQYGGAGMSDYRNNVVLQVRHDEPVPGCPVEVVWPGRSLIGGASMLRST